MLNVFTQHCYWVDICSLKSLKCDGIDCNREDNLYNFLFANYLIYATPSPRDIVVIVQYSITLHYKIIYKLMCNIIHMLLMLLNHVTE